MSNIAQGTIVNLGARLGAIGLGLAIMVVTARLGPVAQGQFSLLGSIEACLLALFSGFGVALARRVSHHGEDPRSTLGATLAACLLSGATCAALVAGLWSHAGDAYRWLWVLAIGAPVLFVPSSVAGVWLGQGRMKPLAVLALATPLLTLLFFACWSIAGDARLDKLLVMLLSWALARLTVGLLVLFRVRSLRFHRPDWSALSHDAKFIATIGGTNLIGLLNYRADLFLVERFLGLAATGVYSVAIALAELLWLISSSVTQAAYARIGTPDRSSAARLVVDLVHANLALLMLAAPVLYVAARLAVPKVLGPGYEDASLVLAAALPGVLGYGAASTLSTYFTNHAGRPQVPAMVAMLSLVINVIVCLVLIPQMGVVGGAVATSVSYLLSVLLMMVLFIRHSGVAVHSLLSPDIRGTGRRLMAIVMMLKGRTA